MGYSIGVNISCNSNCNQWCPRFLKVFCCCRGTGVDDDVDEKVNEVAVEVIGQPQGQLTHENPPILPIEEVKEEVKIDDVD